MICRRQTYDKVKMSYDRFLQLTYDNHKKNHMVSYR